MAWVLLRQNLQIQIFLDMEYPPPPLYAMYRCSLNDDCMQCTMNEGDDHMPVSRGYMRAQYPLLMARYANKGAIPMFQTNTYSQKATLPHKYSTLNN